MNKFDKERAFKTAASLYKEYLKNNSTDLTALAACLSANCKAYARFIDELCARYADFEQSVSTLDIIRKCGDGELYMPYLQTYHDGARALLSKIISYRMPFRDQKQIWERGVEVLIVRDGVQREERLVAQKLTPKQVQQVFDKATARTIEEQRAYLLKPTPKRVFVPTGSRHVSDQTHVAFAKSATYSRPEFCAVVAEVLTEDELENMLKALPVDKLEDLMLKVLPADSVLGVLSRIRSKFNVGSRTPMPRKSGARAYA